MPPACGVGNLVNLIIKACRVPADCSVTNQAIGPTSHGWGGTECRVGNRETNEQWLAGGIIHSPLFSRAPGAGRSGEIPMVEIPVWLLVLLEQALIVTGLLVVWLYLRSRRLSKAFQHISRERRDAGSQLAWEAAGVGVGHMVGQLKNTYSAYNETQQQITAQLEQAAAGSQCQGEVDEVLASIHQDGEALREQIVAVADNFEAFLDDPSALPGNSRTSEQLDGSTQVLNNVIGSLTEVVDVQKEKFGRLLGIIPKLGLEQDAVKQLQASMQSLMGYSEELSLTAGVLRDENQNLQRQLQQMALEHEDSDQARRAQISRLRQALAEKDEAYSQLQKKFASLEAEYLHLYEQSRRGNSATG
jgi:hypothetical protein